MGVPGFVAWLYNNHANTNFIFKQLFKSNSIISDDNEFRIETVQYLLIDTNCLIHPQARQVCLDNPNLVESNIELLEKKIIKQVINYIELLIDQTKPTNTIYIAIDGVAPMAKIKHQRLRRFKSVYDRKIMESIAKKHNKIIYKEWNTSAITPGTIFMDNLMKSILAWINSTIFKCKIIFSSSYSPGEGEHKLLQYFKTIDLKPTDVTIIYGLDADLLFLALSTLKPKIYLMRETSQMEINKSYNNDNKMNTLNDILNDTLNDSFSYLSIDILRTLIRDKMINCLISDKQWITNFLINDFIFLCYFCGNDFLPNIPSLNIKPSNKKIQNGIEIIINTYTNIMNNYNLNIEKTQYLIEIISESNQNHIKINKNIFIKLLDLLSDQEIKYYNNIFKNKRYIHRSYKTDKYEIDKHNYEENIINNYYDPINLGDPKLNIDIWKTKYYKHYFNINIDTTNQNDNSLNIVLDQYLKGLIWTTYYYYDKCKDYEWFYNYHHGPFISDLRNYIKKNPERMKIYEELYSINGLWYYGQIKPLQQLMLVLPYESSFLIPASYRTLLFSYKLRNYFPEQILDIKIDYINKGKAWQNIPMIDIIPARKIHKLTSKIILKEEIERNYLYDDYIKD